MFEPVINKERNILPR